MGTGSTFHWAKRPEREAEHPQPSSAEFKNICSYTSNQHTHLWRRVQLNSENFVTFYFAG
jgi:hypothetical protein